MYNALRYCTHMCPVKHSCFARSLALTLGHPAVLPFYATLHRNHEKLKPCEPSAIAMPSAQWSLAKLLYLGSTSRLKHVCAVGSESTGPDDAMIVSGGVSPAAPPSGRRPAPVINCNNKASWTFKPQRVNARAASHSYGSTDTE